MNEQLQVIQSLNEQNSQSNEINLTINLINVTAHEINQTTADKISEDPIQTKKESVSQTSIVKTSCKIKKLSKKTKQKSRPKVVIDKFDQFLPQFLIQLSQQKLNSLIRIGKEYQVIVPDKIPFKHLYKDMNHLKVWSGNSNSSKNQKEPANFHGQIVRRFQQMFGFNRNQEEICHLMIQYQCSWDRIEREFTKRQIELKKYYREKDKR